MAHYSTLRTHDYSIAEGEEIRGASVYGRGDDKLGKIDDVIFDHTNGNITYVVIDTGGWLTTKKFLVPANQISESAQHDHDYVVDLTKQQIEKFPAYNEDDVESEENWGLYEDRYRESWGPGPVLHREGSSRTVTPASGDLEIGTQSGPALSEDDQTADLEAAGPADDRVFPATGNALEPNPNSGAVGSRWLNFEQQLQRRRKDLTSTCTACSKTPESNRNVGNSPPHRYLGAALTRPVRNFRGGARFEPPDFSRALFALAPPSRNRIFPISMVHGIYPNRFRPHLEMC